MPRSAPGPLTVAPSTLQHPAEASFSPATSASRLDFPQPEGPTMAANCLSGTSSDRESSATIVPVRRVLNSRDTSSIDTRPMLALPGTQRTVVHGSSRALAYLNAMSVARPRKPMAKIPTKIASGCRPQHGLEDHVAETGRSGDQLRDDEKGPGPAHGDPQGIHDAGHGRRQQHPRDDLAAGRTQGVGDLEQILRARAPTRPQSGRSAERTHRGR